VSHERPGPGLADPEAAAAAAHPYGPDRRAAEMAERQVALLGEIAADGAALIRVIRKQAEQANWCGADGPEMYERLARAVRQTLALQTKIDADARLSCEQRAAAYSRREAAEIRALTHIADRSVASIGAQMREIAAEIDREAIGREEPGHRGPKTDREHLLSGLNERLGDKSVDAELSGRTYGEILRTILDDTGINADLSVFTPEQLAQVYGPVQLRRRAAARTAPEGEIAREAPPQRAEAEWPPDGQDGRPSPDLPHERKPPDTG
jgi:hypothetical protein